MTANEPTTIDLITQQIEGLRASIKEMRDDERLFTKAQGLQEQAEAADKRAADANAEIEATKKKLDAARTERDEALQSTIAALAEAMGLVLTIGAPVFSLADDGKVILGLETADGFTPYVGLSGGQKVAFDAALANALFGPAQHPVLVVEAAEMRIDTLRAFIDSLAGETPRAQVVVNTCHMGHAEATSYGLEAAGWDVVELGGKA